MKASYTPILYDFKRAFFRVSTLLFLILFLVGGVGISYLSYNAFINQYPSVNINGFILRVNNTYIFYPIIYDASGNIIDHASIEITGVNEVLYRGTIYSDRENIDQKLSRIFSETNTGETEYRVKVETSIGDTEASLIVMKITVENSSVEYGVIANGMKPVIYDIREKMEKFYPGQGSVVEKYVPKTVIYSRLIVLSKSSGKARLILMAFNLSNTPTYKPSFDLEYLCIKPNKTTISFGEIVELNISDNTPMNSLGRLDTYIGRYDVVLDKDKSVLVIRFRHGNKTIYDYWDYEKIVPVEAIYAGVLASNSGLSLFAQFFPIIFLYLAYTLFVKPRGMGALEFILARPVTRWDIYLTRYLAGVLTAVISTALFIIVLNTSNQLLLGVTIDPWNTMVIYLGLTASLIAFYSLCYMLASSLRSGLYLAIAILLYLLFTMFWGLITLVITFAVGGGLKDYMEISYQILYLNPLGAVSYATYFIQRSYGIVPEVSTADPLYATLSSLAWIIVPFILGYLIFKRINITR